MYVYRDERPHLFTDEGQKLFLKIRDNTKRLLREAGAVRMQEAMSAGSGDSWSMMACVDRMVELGEIRELTGAPCCGQDRVFISNEYRGR